MVEMDEFLNTILGHLPGNLDVAKQAPGPAAENYFVLYINFGRSQLKLSFIGKCSTTALSGSVNDASSQGPCVFLF